MTYSVVTVTGTRSSAEAVEPGSTFMLIDVATIAWEHAWLERLKSTLRYLYGRQSHEGIGRTDTYHTINARLSYAVRRNVRLGAEVRHDVRSSPNPIFEYSRNIMLLTVESTL